MVNLTDSQTFQVLSDEEAWGVKPFFCLPVKNIFTHKSHSKESLWYMEYYSAELYSLKLIVINRAFFSFFSPPQIIFQFLAVLEREWHFGLVKQFSENDGQPLPYRRLGLVSDRPIQSSEN